MAALPCYCLPKRTVPLASHHLVVHWLTAVLDCAVYSYLTGNQISSDSGTSTITQSLLAGCRVIELDTYNQQPGFPGPVCKHGITLTAPVAVRVSAAHTYRQALAAA